MDTELFLETLAAALRPEFDKPGEAPSVNVTTDLTDQGSQDDGRLYIYLGVGQIRPNNANLRNGIDQVRINTLFVEHSPGLASVNNVYRKVKEFGRIHRRWISATPPVLKNPPEFYNWVGRGETQEAKDADERANNENGMTTAENKAELQNWILMPNRLESFVESYGLPQSVGFAMPMVFDVAYKYTV